MKQKEVLYVRIPSKLKDVLATQANHENLSVNQLVLELIENGLFGRQKNYKDLIDTVKNAREIV